MKKQPLFISDEGVEKEIVVTLRQDYDVLYVAESMQGTNDDVILEQANNTGRILITLDRFWRVGISFTTTTYRCFSLQIAGFNYRRKMPARKKYNQ
jgi:hypothetical protein